MAELTGETRVPVTAVPAEPSWWWSRIQWGPVVAGALAGFAAWLIMTTLGAAIGMTAGASMELPATETEAEGAALGFGIGAILWMLLTAIVTGLVAGAVISRTARADRAYMPALFGTLSWSIGVIIALCLTAIGAAGAMGGLGAGAASVAASRTGAFGMEPTQDRDGRFGVERRDTAPDFGARQQPPSAEERTKAREAAEKAATAASTAAWVLLGSQLISLAATMLAAGWRRTHFRRAPTEIRVSPAPSA